MEILCLYVQYFYRFPKKLIQTYSVFPNLVGCSNVIMIYSLMVLLFRMSLVMLWFSRTTLCWRWRGSHFMPTVWSSLTTLRSTVLQQRDCVFPTQHFLKSTSLWAWLVFYKINHGDDWLLGVYYYGNEHCNTALPWLHAQWSDWLNIIADPNTSTTLPNDWVYSTDYRYTGGQCTQDHSVGCDEETITGISWNIPVI